VLLVPNCPYADRFRVSVTDRFRGAPIAARCFCGSLWDASDPDVRLSVWVNRHPSAFSEVLVESAEALLAMTYYEYLRSLHWQRTWALKMESTKDMCEICGARARQVHHVLYRLGQERLEELLAVCRECHAAIHAGQEAPAAP
jgi:hypothetical protein